MRTINIRIEADSYQDAQAISDLMVLKQRVTGYSLNIFAIQQNSFTPFNQKPYYVTSPVHGVKIYYEFEDQTALTVIRRDFDALENFAKEFSQKVRYEMTVQELCHERLAENHNESLSMVQQELAATMEQEKSKWPLLNTRITQQNGSMFFQFSPSSDAQDYAEKAKKLMVASLGLTLIGLFIPGVVGIVLCAIGIVMALASLHYANKANDIELQQPSLVLTYS